MDQCPSCPVLDSYGKGNKLFKYLILSAYTHPGVKLDSTRSLVLWGDREGDELALYRKIPKISPGAYILQRTFLRRLFWKGLIFGGACRREICIWKLAGLITEDDFLIQAPGGTYLDGLLN